MTYAAAQEAAAGALHQLLDATCTPAPSDNGGAHDHAGGPAVAGLVLECRHQAHLALGERLARLGTYRSVPTGQVSVGKGCLDAARHPLRTLARVMLDLPTPAPAPGLLDGVGRIPPSTLLTAPVRLLTGLARGTSHPDPTSGPDGGAAGGRGVASGSALAGWQTLARSLTVGNIELFGAAEQPWTGQDRAAWYLVGDAADTLEGLVVLDQALSTAGLLARRHREVWVAARLAVGDVSRVASWYGQDLGADLATSTGPGTRVGWARTPDGDVVPLAQGGPDGPRVRLVTQAADFAPAQRALAGFLRPVRASAEVSAEWERPGLTATRVVAAGQAHLAATFSDWAARTPGAEHLADRFADRGHRFAALHATTRRLAELTPRPTPLVVGQQLEMLTELRVVTDRGALPDTRQNGTANGTLGGGPVRGVGLSVAQLADLDAASHQVAIAAGKALRREGMHRRHLLSLNTDPRLGLPVAEPIRSRHHPFHRACTDLAREPAPPHPTPSTASAAHPLMAGPDPVPVLGRQPDRGIPGLRVNRDQLARTLAGLPVGQPSRVRRLDPPGPAHTL